MRSTIYIFLAAALFAACKETKTSTTTSSSQSTTTTDPYAVIEQATPSTREMLADIRRLTSFEWSSRLVSPRTALLPEQQGISLQHYLLDKEVHATSDGGTAGTLTLGVNYQDGIRLAAGYLIYSLLWDTQAQQWRRSNVTLTVVPPNGFTTLQGRVVEVQTDLPVPNASLHMMAAGKPVTVFTDAEGRFAAAGLPPGLNQVRVEHSSFVASVFEVDATQPVLDLGLVRLQRDFQAGQRVHGTLGYRTACQGGWAPAGPFDSDAKVVAPFVWLEDTLGNVIAQATPSMLGEFDFLGVPQGDYRLRVQFETLNQFWQGSPVDAYPIGVTGDVNVGTVCLNNDNPQLRGMTAVWQDNSSDAYFGATLHVPSNAGRIMLIPEVFDEDTSLQLNWYADRSGFDGWVTSATSAGYMPQSTAPTLLFVQVTDGRGGHFEASLPMQLHPRVIAPHTVYGVDFADPSSLGRYTLLANADGVWSTTGGLLAQVSDSPNGGYLEAGLRAEYTPESELAATLNFAIAELAEGAHFGLRIWASDRGVNYMLRVLRREGAYVWELGDPVQVFAQGPYVPPTHGQDTMTLSFDPLTGLLRGSFGTWLGARQEARVAPVAPGYVIMLGLQAQALPSNGLAALAVRFDQMAINRPTSATRLWLEPGMFAGISYADGVYLQDSAGVYAVPGEIDVTTSGLLYLSRVYVTGPRGRITVYSMVDRNSLSPDLGTIVGWDEGILAPTRTAGVYLY